jgi:hypothetical protein
MRLSLLISTVAVVGFLAWMIPFGRGNGGIYGDGRTVTARLSPPAPTPDPTLPSADRAPPPQNR